MCSSQRSSPSSLPLPSPLMIPLETFLTHCCLSYRHFLKPNRFSLRRNSCLNFQGCVSFLDFHFAFVFSLWVSAYISLFHVVFLFVLPLALLCVRLFNKLSTTLALRVVESLLRGLLCSRAHPILQSCSDFRYPRLFVHSPPLFAPSVRVIRSHKLPMISSLCLWLNSNKCVQQLQIVSFLVLHLCLRAPLPLLRGMHGHQILPPHLDRLTLKQNGNHWKNRCNRVWEAKKVQNRFLLLCHFHDSRSFHRFFFLFCVFLALMAKLTSKNIL